MQDRTLKIIILLIIPMVLYLLPLPFTPLMEPDEGRYSAIPNEMNTTGDYVTPRLKGAVYFEKPPLSYWATALSFKVFGKNEFASRLFVALCAWGCILLTYRAGLFFHDAREGLYGAAVLSTFLFHAAIGRINILDMPLALFVCLSIWCGFRYFAADRRSRKWIYLCYLFSALAFLTKGLIGIAFPFGVVAVWLWFSGRWRDSLRLFSPVGIVIFLAVSMPWLILVQRENPDFFRFFFIQEHFLRYATRMHDRYQPFYFFIPVVLAGTLPWCAFLPEAMGFLKKGEKAGFGIVEKRLLWTWAGLIFLFFSISSSKLIPYIAPVFPPLALFCGRMFRIYEDDLQSRGDRKGPPFARRIPVVLQSVLFAAVLVAPLFLEKYRLEWSGWWPWIVFPALMLVLINVIPNRVRRKWGRGWFLAAYLIFSAFIFSVTFPVSVYMTPYKSAYPISQAIQTFVPEGAKVYQYGMSLYGIDFYTGMRTPIVDDIGEVRYGSEQLPKEERERYFLNSPSFFKLLKEEKGAVYCATEAGERLEDLKKEIPDLTVMWHNTAYYLLKLK
ncbi:MAG: glycosyltransferase family 39 protein [Deltaproteobacteria bacterium]|nr:glycosyltransferase family 39 protein [Deltaproteobacteria bacterium]